MALMDTTRYYSKAEKESRIGINLYDSYEDDKNKKEPLAILLRFMRRDQMVRIIDGDDGEILYYGRIGGFITDTAYGLIIKHFSIVNIETRWTTFTFEDNCTNTKEVLDITIIPTRDGTRYYA